MVLAFALRGLFRGTVRQVCGLLGVVLGLWVAGWALQWVGLHWHGARPAVVFMVLRWLVAALAGLATAALLESAGALLAGAVRSSPLGWVDRAGGFVVGAAFGLLVISLAVLLMLAVPWPAELRAAAARSRVAPQLLDGGRRASAALESVLPGGPWLRHRFENAGRRVARSGRPA